MGYYYTFSGSLKIEPAMPRQLVRDLTLAEDQDDQGNDLVAHHRGEEDTVGVVNGTIGVIPGKSYTEVECRWEEPSKAYTLGDHFGTLAVTLKKLGGYTVTGAIYMSGEDSPDFTRFRIDSNGDAHQEEPEFLWPNGDKGWG